MYRDPSDLTEFGRLYLTELERKQDQVLQQLRTLLDRWQGDFAGQWKSRILETVEQGFRDMSVEYQQRYLEHRDRVKRLEKELQKRAKGYLVIALMLVSLAAVSAVWLMLGQ